MTYTRFLFALIGLCTFSSCSLQKQDQLYEHYELGYGHYAASIFFVPSELSADAVTDADTLSVCVTTLYDADEYVNSSVGRELKSVLKEMYPGSVYYDTNPDNPPSHNLIPVYYSTLLVDSITVISETLSGLYPGGDITSLFTLRVKGAGFGMPRVWFVCRHSPEGLLVTDKIECALGTVGELRIFCPLTFELRTTGLDANLLKGNNLSIDVVFNDSSHLSTVVSM